MPEERDDGTVLSKFEFQDAWFGEGFTSIPNVILTNPRLSGMAKMTYVALLSFAWGPMQAYPGQDRLAEMLAATPRSLRKYIDELEREQLIRVTRRGQGLTDIYRFLRPRAEHSSPPERNVASTKRRSRPATISVPVGNDLPAKKPQGKKDGGNTRRKGLATPLTRGQCIRCGGDHNYRACPG